MEKDMQKLLKNPARRFSEVIAAAKLELTGIRLGSDWGIPTPRSAVDFGLAPDHIRKISGG